MSDLSPEARALLDATAHADDPSPADRDRVGRALAASLGLAALAPATAQAASVAVATTTALKVVAIAAVLATAGVVWTRRSPVAPRPTAVPAWTPAPVVPFVTAAPAVAVPVARAAVVPAVPVVPPVRAHLARGATSTVDSLREESELLGEAHRATQSGEPARALALLAAYRERFPRGVLREERDVERILALCRLERRAEAQLAARGFLRSHPRSPLAPRVEGSCARSPARPEQ